MVVSAILHMKGISSSSIYQTLLLVVGVLFEVVVVSIELMCFHLETIRYRLFTVLYYLLELVMAVWINIMIPFAGLIVLTTFSIAKNVYRVLFVEKVYRPLGYYELCKKFGIKVKKPSVRKSKNAVTKKRVSVTSTKSKQKVHSKREKPVDAGTSKSYA